MKKRLIVLVAVVAVLSFSACAKDDGPVVISVDKTPVNQNMITPSPSPVPTPTLTPEPSPTPQVKEEIADYVEDLTIEEEFSTLYFGGWNFGGNRKPFTIEGQSYNKGIGMYIKSRNIKSETGSESVTFELGRRYHKMTFDLGCEQTLQYAGEDKYGKYQITIYADDAQIWDSGLNDYKFAAIGQEVEIPEGCEMLTIKLTQSKGINGTLNVAMGALKFYYYK